MKLFLFNLFFTLSFTTDCILSETDFSAQYPFCFDVVLHTKPLDEEYDGLPIDPFLTCSLHYWQEFRLDSPGSRQKSPFPYTLFINLETGKPQSTNFRGGGEADPDLLDRIKKHLSSYKGDYDEVHYMDDELFQREGLRLVFHDSQKENLIYIWGRPIQMDSWGIFIPSEKWIPESKFLADINKYHELFFGTCDISENDSKPLKRTYE